MGRSNGTVIAVSVLFHHRAESGQNFQDNAVETVVDIAVSKAQHPIPAPLQPVIPRGISRSVLRQLMLHAIDFDDQALGEASKVNDEAFNGVLATKVIALCSEFPKLLPQAFFGNRFSPSQLPRNLIGHLAKLFTSPLAPPLRGGE